MRTYFIHNDFLTINAQGENNHCAILSEKDVRQIRLLYRDGKFTQKELAVRYMVGRSTIGDIVHRRTWRHIPIHVTDDDYLTASMVRLNGDYIITVYAVLADHSSEIIETIRGDEEAVLEFQRKYHIPIFVNEALIS